MAGRGDMLTITAKATASPTTDLGEFRAIAADWLPDRERERFERGAFSKAIEQWKGVGKHVPLLWAHQPGPQNVVGSVDPGLMAETESGLEVGGKVDLGTEQGQKAWEAVKSGTLGLSLGFLAGRRFKGDGDVWVLDQIDILEVSLTPKPVQAGTRVLDFKSLAEQLDEQAAEDERLRKESDALLRQESEAVQDEAEGEGEEPSDVGQEVEDNKAVLVALEHFHLEELKAAYAGALKAVWTAAFINDLPDSCFLYVESGGSKDGEGKTTPRSLRHFPYKDSSGTVDMPHLRNALSRIPQSNLPQAVKDRVAARAQRILNDQKSTDRGQTRARSVDPLYQESMHTVAGVQSGGVVSLPKPPPQQEPEDEQELPSVARLKQESRRLGAWLVTGDTENGDKERA